ncbi:MAG: AAA family ATPase [Phycisphaerales bacterium]|nr:AAA family ATPase [Phycisphaerales bacterium]
MIALPTGHLAAVAQAYLKAGLCVLPADRETKRPVLPAWKEFQERCPSEDEVDEWFSARIDAICLVCGAVSGNLEIIDFDAGGEMYEAWRALVEENAPGLVERLGIERTPSGGYHIAYRAQTPVLGSAKLAQRRVETDGPEQVPNCGKTFKPRKDRATGQWFATVTLIETRGEGGLSLCAPSPKYEMIQGDLAALPTITEDEREILLGCASDLNEIPLKVIDAPRTSLQSKGEGNRPGDDYNERGDVRGLLVKHGWTLARGGENEHWRRPGKNSGVSATLKNGVFYVFSSNASPFEPSRGYSRFTVYALLEHDGDYVAAASDLRVQGYGVTTDGHVKERPPQPRNPYLVRSTPIVGPSILSVRELIVRHPRQREPVVEGLLRLGETMNLIAASKSRKSWSAHALAIAIATGRSWLDRFPTVRGEVLILDNELHHETLAYRIPRIVEAMGIPLADVQDRIHVDSLRGRCPDVFGLRDYFESLEPGRYRMIILDAFYRFLPRGVNENDNGSMAQCYNAIDGCADQMQSSFCLLHHASKGNQSFKSVTDVGAGAGSLSRATDTHLVLRPHEQSDVVVLEAAGRSWASVKPVCLRWRHPLWVVDEGLDPTALKSERPQRRTRESRRSRASAEVDVIVATYFSAEPVAKVAVLEIIRDKEGLSVRMAERLVKEAETSGLIHRWSVGRAHKVCYATVPQPEGSSE